MTRSLGLWEEHLDSAHCNLATINASHRNVTISWGVQHAPPLNEDQACCDFLNLLFIHQHARTTAIDKHEAVQTVLLPLRGGAPICQTARQAVGCAGGTGEAAGVRSHRCCRCAMRIVSCNGRLHKRCGRMSGRKALRWMPCRAPIHPDEWESVLDVVLRAIHATQPNVYVHWLTPALDGRPRLPRRSTCASISSFPTLTCPLS